MLAYWRFFFSVVVCALLFAGCSTPPVSNQAMLDGVSYDSELEIKDLTAKSNHSGNIKVYEVPMSAARFEGTGPLGIRLFSLVVTKKSFTAVIYPEKKIISGNSKSSLAPLLKVDLTAESLMYFINGQTPPGAWDCKAMANKTECKLGSGQLSVGMWKEEEIFILDIKNSNKQLIWNLEANKTKVRLKVETFSLPRPEGFKSIQLN